MKTIPRTHSNIKIHSPLPPSEVHVTPFYDVTLRCNERVRVRSGNFKAEKRFGKFRTEVFICFGKNSNFSNLLFFCKRYLGIKQRTEAPQGVLL